MIRILFDFKKTEGKVAKLLSVMHIFIRVYSTCNLYEQLFLSLNVQSLPAKFNELEELITFLKNNRCEPDFICLQSP